MATVQPDVRQFRPRSESDSTCEGKCFVDILEVCMRFEKFSFGSIRIDGVTYQHDVVIDRGDVRKRKKKPSKKYREEHTRRFQSKRRFPGNVIV